MRRRFTVLILTAGIALILYAGHSIYLVNKNPLISDTIQTVDKREFSPQKLFEKNWQTIKNEYYDSTFNHQHWSRWKNHYQNKILLYLLDK